MLTRIPAVLERLAEIFTTATADLADPVKVLDAPMVGEPPLRVVFVGGNWRGQGGYSATVTRQPGYGKPRLTEAWDVRCFASVQLKTDSARDARNAVADLLAVLDGAVRDNGPCEAWDTAEITGNVEWVPEITNFGAACSLVFTVSGAGLL